MPGSYFICATPRTGSTLLCSFLKSSRVAGHPESYFRKQDETKWAQTWKIAPHDGQFSFHDYLKACISAGRGENGVFAARVMWGTMEEIVANLATLYGQTDSSDIDLLRRAFGDSRFIYLRRKNLVAQAVSRLRAEQTDVWHVTDNSGLEPPVREPEYDSVRIRQFVHEAKEHNAAWQDWFYRNDIEPYTLDYEALAHDPVSETLNILDFLGLTLPPDAELQARNARMADKLSESWIERFRAEAD